MGKMDKKKRGVCNYDSVLSLLQSELFVLITTIFIDKFEFIPCDLIDIFDSYKNKNALPSGRTFQANGTTVASLYYGAVPSIRVKSANRSG